MELTSTLTNNPQTAGYRYIKKYTLTTFSCHTQNLIKDIP